MSTPLAAEQLRLAGLLLLLMSMAQVLPLWKAVLLHWPPPSPPSWSWMVLSCLREQNALCSTSKSSCTFLWLIGD